VSIARRSRLASQSETSAKPVPPEGDDRHILVRERAVPTSEVTDSEVDDLSKPVPEEVGVDRPVAADLYPDRHREESSRRHVLVLPAE
jgi:hypothetical protein